MTSSLLTTDNVDELLEKLQPFLEAARDKRKPRDVDPLYKHVQREFKTSWRMQRDDFQRELRKMRGDFSEARKRSVSRKKLDAAWERAVKKGAKRQIQVLDADAKRALERGGKSALTDLAAATYDIAWDIKSPEAIKFLKDRGAKAVKGISKTTRDRIKRLIVDMADSGKSYGEVSREINALFDNFSRVPAGVVSRGELIAVTEMGDAYEAGRRQVLQRFKRKGIATEKRWITVGDERVCNICAPNGSEDWIKESTNFSSGHVSPLGHPACRCDMGVRVAA